MISFLINLESDKIVFQLRIPFIIEWRITINPFLVFGLRGLYILIGHNQMETEQALPSPNQMG